MCGRSACTLEPDQIISIFQAAAFKGREKYRTSWNVGPGQWQPVLIWDPESSCRVIVSMKWGLVPSWSENDSTGTHPINARCETIESKPMFSRLFKNKRCVVIADGYFEWEKRPDGKQPYFHRFFQPADIKNENFKHEQKMKETKIKQEPSSSQQTQDTGVYSISKPITFAGLYDVWVNPKTGEELYTYTIITVPASKAVEWIHDRMPAILDYEEIDIWLKSHSLKEALTLLKPYPKPLEIYPVSRVVNNIRNQTPECVLPLRSLSQVEKKPLVSNVTVKQELSSSTCNRTLDSFIKKETPPIKCEDTKDRSKKEEIPLPKKRKQPEESESQQSQSNKQQKHQ